MHNKTDILEALLFFLNANNNNNIFFNTECSIKLIYLIQMPIYRNINNASNVSNNNNNNNDNINGRTSERFVYRSFE